MGKGTERSEQSEQLFTLEEAARRLGLHYMTVYRYLRLGRLEADKREGRWLVSSAEVDRLLRRRKPSPARRGAATPGRSQRLMTRMVSGDAPGSWAIIEETLAASSPTSVYVDLLGPALRQLGEDWAAGRISIGEEHRATAIALGVVGRLSPLFARPGRRRGGTVILAGAAADFHAIPVTMVADVLRGEGYPVVQLGADVPRSTLLETVAAARGLTAVGLSMSVDGDAERVADAIAAIRRAHPHLAVLVGGPAVPDQSIALELGADHWAPDAAATAELLGRLDRPTRRRPNAGPPVIKPPFTVR